jgi:hypothetical protein
MNIWDFLETNKINTLSTEEPKENNNGSSGGGCAGAIEKEEEKPEENPFDLLNTEIEKNYKQYQRTTKKLENYKDEYAIAPEMFKPTLMANYNKLVNQNNDLVKQLQTDIEKRDQIINTANQNKFMQYKQLTEAPEVQQQKETLISQPDKPMEKPKPLLDKVKDTATSIFGTWEAK